MVGIRIFVDEGLGHSSYLVDLGDGTAAILDPPRFPTEHLAAADAQDIAPRWTINIELGGLAHSAIPESPVTVMCGHGERAMTGLSILTRRGHRNVSVLDGGPETWTEWSGQVLAVGP